jgi:molybdenum cofactor biosynthesis protein B
VRCADVTISDTRTLETDRGGALIVKMLGVGGHEVSSRQIVRDDPREIEPMLLKLADPAATDAVLMTGGTGIAARDRTFETVSGLLTKAMPGYGELFRMLSYADIGPAAMLSRAVGGKRRSSRGRQERRPAGERPWRSGAGERTRKG